MPFKIVNETYYTNENENPEKYGYIEGYTSNTAGATFLRINCKVTLDEDFEAFNEKAREILRKMISNERLKDGDEDILDFLYAPDCGGKISYKTCKKIYELIKDTDCKYCLRYAAYSHNDWADFKQLLKECYSHRASLVWY